jgi:hypothetical protein
VTGSFELPLLSVLGLPSISMELGEPRSKRWWSRPRNDRKRLVELARLIESEWRGITDKLVETARAHLEARRSSITREASQIYAGVVEVFKEQNQARLERAHALIDTGKQADGSELQRSHHAKTSELNTEISDLDNLLDRLDKLNLSMRREGRTAG